MEHIFYFITIAPILYELFNLFGINKAHQFAMGFKDLKDKKYEEWSDVQKSYSVFMLGYIVWIFIGLFTFQWALFLGFFIFGLIPKKYIWYRWIDSLISFFVLCFIVINAYHFKIDVWKYLVCALS